MVEDLLLTEEEKEEEKQKEEALKLARLEDIPEASLVGGVRRELYEQIMEENVEYLRLR